MDTMLITYITLKLYVRWDSRFLSHYKCSLTLFMQKSLQSISLNQYSSQFIILLYWNSSFMKFVHISDTTRLRWVCLLHLKLCEICSIIPIWCIYSHMSVRQTYWNWNWVAGTRYIFLEAILTPKHTNVHAYLDSEYTHIEIWREEKEWVNIKFVFEESPSPCIRRDISIRWKFWSHGSVNAQYSTYYTCIFTKEKKRREKERWRFSSKKVAGKTP